MVTVAAAALALHGLAHLLGAVIYLQWGTVEGLAFKTTVLAGRIDLGEIGIQIFGILWALAALGFVGTAALLYFNLSWWQPVLVGAALLSLALIILDWKDAFGGGLINIAILLSIVVTWLRDVMS